MVITDKQKRVFCWIKLESIFGEELRDVCFKPLLIDMLNETSSSNDMVALVASITTNVNICANLIEVLKTDSLGVLYDFCLIL